MNMKRILVMVAIVMGIALVHAQAATDLMKFVPSDWPVIVRVDSSSATASGAFLKSVKEKPDYKEIAELNQSFYTGIQKLIAAIGVELPPADGSLIPWWGEQMVIAMDPASKTPSVIVAIASKDRSLAKQTLSDVMGSIVRDSDPIVQDIAGTQVVTWTIPKGKMEAAYAAGDGFVLFADSAARLRNALSTSAGPSQSMQAALNQHADDIIAFAVDAAPIVSKHSTKASDKQSLVAVAASQIKAHGGLSLGEKGMLFAVYGDVPSQIMGMAGQMMGLPVEPGTTTASSSELAVLLPKNSLAAAFVSTATSLAMMQNPLKDAGASVASLNSIAAMLNAAGESPVAIALQSLIPEAAFVAVCQKDSSAHAAEMMATWQKKLGSYGLKGSQKGDYIIIASNQPKSEMAGFARQIGSAVVFGSDWRSAQKVSAVTQETSLATRTSYADVNSILGASESASAWVSLDGISAMGYLYESLVGRNMAVLRPFLDAVKGTEGVGVSVGITPNGAVAKLAVKTTIVPQSPLFSAYAIAIPAAIMFPIFGGARSSAQVYMSESNLKQLALAAIMYSNDQNGKLPPSKTWEKSLQPYLKDTSVFASPSGIAYQYNYKLAGVDLATVTNASQVILFYEGIPGVPVGPNALAFQNGKAHVAYLDGHVQVLSTPPSMDSFKAVIKAKKPALPRKTPRTKSKK